MTESSDEPTRVARLPHDAHGRPVPQFVAWIDGKPDFRVIAPGKIDQAVENRTCWMCGGKLTRHAAFIIGPMCVVNRTTAEPPCHIDCAEYAATHCPFLTVPQMTRRETGKPDGIVDPPGEMIRRNPGAVVLWITKTWSLFSDGRGGLLFQIGDPSEVRWFAKGRAASREEAEESIASGLPILMELHHATLAHKRRWHNCGNRRSPQLPTCRHPSRPPHDSALIPCPASHQRRGAFSPRITQSGRRRSCVVLPAARLLCVSWRSWA